VVCDTFAFGSLVVAVPAAARDLGAPALAGVLLSIGSLGAVISGLIYGSRKRSGSPGSQLAMYHFAGAVVLVLAGHVSLIVLLALLIFGVGLVGGPRDTLHQVVLGEAAPPHYRTEAFAWLGTLMWVGYAGGTAASGQLVQLAHGRVTGAFLEAGCAAALAAALSLLVRKPAAEPQAQPEPAPEPAAENAGD
jgi:MFS family permease